MHPIRTAQGRTAQGRTARGRTAHGRTAHGRTAQSQTKTARCPGAALLAAILVTGASIATQAARAEQITGLYVGAGIGYTLLQDQLPAVDTVVNYVPTRTVNTRSAYDGGIAGLGSIGYGVGNGVRLEIEGSYRRNPQQRQSSGGASAGGAAAGTEAKYGVMANVFYDFNLGLRWMAPYIGAGAGYQFAAWNRVSVQAGGLTFQTAPGPVTTSQTLGKVAYQGVIGAAFPIEAIPGLAVTAEYRYMGLAGQRDYASTATFLFASPAKTKTHVGTDENHTFLVGLRYAFDTTPAAPPASPPPPRPQTFAPVPATRTFLVFFDWDRSDITARAREIIAEAVRASGSTPHTRIEVGGNADRSGTPAYNLALSQRRAEAVADEMMRWGVPRGLIDIRAYGDSRPLVATGSGAREPQNRRVEIVYR